MRYLQLAFLTLLTLTLFACGGSSNSSSGGGGGGGGGINPNPNPIFKINEGYYLGAINSIAQGSKRTHAVVVKIDDTYAVWFYSENASTRTSHTIHTFKRFGNGYTENLCGFNNFSVTDSCKYTGIIRNNIIRGFYSLNGVSGSYDSGLYNLTYQNQPTLAHSQLASRVLVSISSTSNVVKYSTATFSVGGFTFQDNTGCNGLASHQASQSSSHIVHYAVVVRNCNLSRFNGNYHYFITRKNSNTYLGVSAKRNGGGNKKARQWTPIVLLR